MSTFLQLQSFFVDRKVVLSRGAEAAVASFKANEPGYFKAILAAMCWGLDTIKLENIDFTFIDELHQKLVPHLTLDPRVADGPRNFGLVPGVTCDEVGLRKFMSDYYGGQKYYLDMTVFDKQTKPMQPIGRYFFLNSCMQIANLDTGDAESMQALTPEYAADFVVKHFFTEENATIKLNSMMSAAQTKGEVIPLLKSLTKRLMLLAQLRPNLSIEKFQVEVDKVLLKHMTQLNQIHTFMDGNARLSFVLTNLILYKFNLPLFWPSEQSVLEMLGEQSGLKMFEQSRNNFTESFGDTATFVESLKASQLESQPSVAARITMWKEKTSVGDDAVAEESIEERPSLP